MSGALGAWMFLLLVAAPPGTEERSNLVRHRLKDLRRLERREHSVLARIEVEDQTAAALRGDLDTVRSREEEARIEEARLKREISDEGARLASRRQATAQRVRALFRLGRGGLLRILFSADSFPDLARRANLIGRVLSVDRQALRQYEQDIQAKEDRSRTLSRVQTSLQAMQEDAQATLDALQQGREEKVALLDRVRREKHLAQQTLEELRQAEERMERTVLRGSPSVFPGEGFSSLEGRLPWPVEGHLAGGFGPREDPRTHTTVVYKGIDLEAAAGTAVRAVADGRIVHADWFRGYGRLLILDHGDRFYTLYAHLDRFAHAVGETVHRGEVIGWVGETGTIAGPMLHFEIRHQDRALDPLIWLNPAFPAGSTVATGGLLR